MAVLVVGVGAWGTTWARRGKSTSAGGWTVLVSRVPLIGFSRSAITRVGIGTGSEMWGFASGVT